MPADFGMAVLLAVMGGMNGWNCITLFRDKQVAGISPTTMLFRGGANAYQAYFLFALDQWLSFSIAVPATALSLAWVAQAFYYRRWPGGRGVCLSFAPMALPSMGTLPCTNPSFIDGRAASASASFDATAAPPSGGAVLV